MTEFETVTRAIRAHVGAPDDPRYPDFYTPHEWRKRGEEYGLTAVAIVVHDGGAFAPCFSHDYEDYAAMDAMHQALAACGYWAEQCTSWYTAIYRV